MSCGPPPHDASRITVITRCRCACACACTRADARVKRERFMTAACDCSLCNGGLYGRRPHAESGLPRARAEAPVPRCMRCTARS